MRAHGCSGSSLRCWSIHSESNAGTRVARASPSLRQPDQRSSQRQLARRGRVASVSVPTKARPFPHAIPTADTVARERIGATTEDDGAGLEMRHHFLDYGLEDRIVRRVVHPCTHTHKQRRASSNLTSTPCPCTMPCPCPMYPEEAWRVGESADAGAATPLCVEPTCVWVAA